METLKIDNVVHPLIDNSVELSIELPTEPGEIPITRTTSLKVPMTSQLSAICDPNGYQGVAPKATLVTQRFSLDGTIYPTQITENERGTTAEVVLLSGNAGWVQKLKERSMKVLDMSKFNHLVNMTNIENSWRGDLPYCYYTADRGDEVMPGERTIYEFRPALKVAILLKEIFRQAGVNLISNTLNASTFGKYFVVYEPGDNIRNCESVDYKRCCVKTNASQRIQYATNTPTSINILALGSYEIIDFADIVINDEIYDPDQKAAVVPDGHENLALWVHVSFQFNFSRAFPTIIFSDDAGNPSMATVILKLLRNGITVSMTAINVSNYEWGKPFTISLPPYGDYGIVGAKYQLRIEINGYLYAPTTAGNVEFNITKGGWLKYAPSGWWKIGANTDLKALLPDEIQSDFVAKIAKAFDLIFATDMYGINVYCETRASWLNSFVNPIEVESLIGGVQWQAAPRLENNVERYTMIEDGSDKGQYATRKNRILDIKLSNAAIMTGVEEYTIDFSDTLFKGWMLKLHSEPLKWKDIPYTWEFGPRLLYFSGRQNVTYRINGTYKSWQVPVWQAVDVNTIAQWHATRRLQLEIGKEVKLKVLMSYDLVNSIIAQGGIRRAVKWRGQQYYLTNMTIRSDSDIVEITLLPLLSYSGDIGGKPLPTTIPPEVMASAGAEDILIVAEDEILALS
jgi:hypothetical protein